MRKRFLSSLAAVVAGAGAACGQSSLPPIERMGPAPSATLPVAVQTGVVDPEPIAPPPGANVPPSLPMPPEAMLTVPSPLGTPMIPSGMLPTGPTLGSGIGTLVSETPGFFGGQACDAPDGTASGGRYPGIHCLKIDIEWLLWFLESQNASPPLLTTGSPVSQGILGFPTTQVLAGGQGMNAQNGFRGTVDYWCGPTKRWGLQGSVLVLENQNQIVDVASDFTGIPVLARPYIDSTTGFGSSLLIAFPQLAYGRGTIQIGTQLYGAEGNVLVNLYRGLPEKHSWNLNFLAGFRYLELYDRLYASQSTDLLPGNNAQFAGLSVAGPANITVTDLFETRNSFYGGQLGVISDFKFGRWSVTGAGKVAFGSSVQQLDISGQSTLASRVSRVSAAVQGGLLANAGNIGRYRIDEFTVLPELSLNVGYDLCRGVRAFIGYNLLYMPNVVRPLDQVNMMVNSSLVPTSPNYGRVGFVPVSQLPLVQDNLWISGMNLGLSFRY